MKKNKMIVAVIFTFTLLTTAFAMSGSGNQQPIKDAQQVKQDVQTVIAQSTQDEQSDQKETPKRATIAQLEGYVLENVWPDQENEIDVAEYEKTKKEFAEKARKIGVMNEKMIRVFYWKYRINVNKLKEMRELGADTVTYRVSENMTLLDRAMEAQAVVIGTITDVEFTSGVLHTSYKVNVDEVIIGRDLVKEFPQTIFVKFAEKLNDPKTIYLDSSVKYHKIGNKYMFFLNRTSFEGHARYNKLKITKEINQPYSYMASSSFDLTELDKYKNFFKKENNKEFDFDELKEKIKKIGQLNDKANFFNRSYK